MHTPDPLDHVVLNRPIRDWLWKGIHLGNYEPGRIVLFTPGWVTEIKGAIADQLGEICDSHNYRVWQSRIKQFNENSPEMFASSLTDIRKFVAEYRLVMDADGTVRLPAQECEYAHS